MEMFCLRLDAGTWVYTSVDSVSLPGRLVHFVVCKLCPDRNDWENK